MESGRATRVFHPMVNGWPSSPARMRAVAPISAMCSLFPWSPGKWFRSPILAAMCTIFASRGRRDSSDKLLVLSEVEGSICPTPFRSVTMSNLIGQSLGRYHILERLGEGGMATVYKAHDTQLDRDVAIKVILPTAFSEEGLERARARFMREAKVLASFNHENIVDVLDYGEQNGVQYIVMKYIPGGTLKQLLENQSKPMQWKESVALLIPIARALEYAHQHDIIHRDIKPSNILINKDGKPMLSDFGIAKILESDFVSDQTEEETTGYRTWIQDPNETRDARHGNTTNLTGSKVGIGTPPYMSPEQGLGKIVDRRTDIYSLGIVLYEMVTGRTPFRASTPEAIIDKHVFEQPPKPKMFAPQLPDKVGRLLSKALEKNPSNRYQDAREFAKAMEALNKTHTSYPVLPIIAGGIILLLIVSAGLWYTQSTGVQHLVTMSGPTSQDTPTLLTADSVISQTSTLTPTEQPVVTNTPDANLQEITDSKGVVMRLVPAGEFTMGSDNGDSDEQPVHQVFLDAYYMDTYEVTNVLYEACVNAGVCDSPHETSSYTYSSYYGNLQYENFPVIKVDWNQAKTFCGTWRGARLPTEAEWEKAARGTDGRTYPWGDSFDGTKTNFCDKNCSFDWSDKNYDDGYTDTAPVGSYESGKSPYGLYDMAGNVWEWVADWYSETYYQSSPFENPLGPDSGQYRALRGGSWSDIEVNARTSSRFWYEPDDWDIGLGFRCSRSLP